MASRAWHETCFFTCDDRNEGPSRQARTGPRDHGGDTITVSCLLFERRNVMSDFDRIARALLGPPPARNTADSTANILALGARGVGGTATAVGASAGGAIFISPICAVVGAVAGMYALSLVPERRDAVGRYNSFLQAFARSVSDFSRGSDRRRRSFVYQDSAIRGRNAAVHTLDRIGRAKRDQILRRYGRMSDSRAVAAMVDRLGGYLVN